MCGICVSKQNAHNFLTTLKHSLIDQIMLYTDDTSVIISKDTNKAIDTQFCCYLIT